MNEEKISQVWAPNYNNAIQLLSKKRDINSVDTTEIEESINKLLN